MTAHTPAAQHYRFDLFDNDDRLMGQGIVTVDGPNYRAAERALDQIKADAHATSYLSFPITDSEYARLTGPNGPDIPVVDGRQEVAR